MTFDWHTWLMVQRLLAQGRAGTGASKDALEDPEYAWALDLANRADRLKHALADAEREARSRAPGRGRS